MVGGTGSMFTTGMSEILSESAERNGARNAQIYYLATHAHFDPSHTNENKNS
jgi:hypothetical protein